MLSSLSNFKNKIINNYNDKNYRIEFEERNITENVKLGYTEEEHVAWLTGKDGCIMLCHF